MTEADLFAARQRTDWNRAPIQSFETWLARQAGRGTSRTLRPSTAKVYLAQWRAWTATIILAGVATTVLAGGEA